MPVKSDRERFILKLFKASGIACFIAAAVFIVIGVLLRFDSVYNRYSPRWIRLSSTRWAWR